LAGAGETPALHAWPPGHPASKAPAGHIGCASACPNQALSYHQLLQTADDQLYAAKKAGRDCVRAKYRTA